MRDIIINTLGISLLVNTLFFIYAAKNKTDTVTDLSYGLSFLSIASYVYATSNVETLTQTLVYAMVILWSIRISTFLFIRVKKTGRDKRFDEMRDDPFKFGRFWLLQALSAWIIMLPASLLIQRSYELSAATVIVGTLIWLVGIVVEAIADLQLYNFRFNTQRKKHPWISSGLWKHSRHPNYFGEITLWWGLFFIGTSGYSGYEWTVIVGPLTITCLLLFISGIPLLEKANDKRWSSEPGYKEHKNNTRMLLPLPK